MTTCQKECCFCNPQIQRLSRILKNKSASWEKKLLALIGLAHIASEETIKILEHYYKNPDKEMKFYARLALDEARQLNRA